jgi:hypothetical protein
MLRQWSDNGNFREVRKVLNPHFYARLMSKHESPMTEWYWKRVGGLLIEEYPVVSQGTNHGVRRLDGLIIRDESVGRAFGERVDISGRDVIVVQAKARRLGMPLMGQTLFSLNLVKALGPASAIAVALCTADDAVLRPLLEAHEGCFVEVYSP